MCVFNAIAWRSVQTPADGSVINLQRSITVGWLVFTSFASSVIICIISVYRMMHQFSMTTWNFDIVAFCAIISDTVSYHFPPFFVKFSLIIAAHVHNMSTKFRQKLLDFILKTWLSYKSYQWARFAHAIFTYLVIFEPRIFVLASFNILFCKIFFVLRRINYFQLCQR